MNSEKSNTDSEENISTALFSGLPLTLASDVREWTLESRFKELKVK